MLDINKDYDECKQEVFNEHKERFDNFLNTPPKRQQNRNNSLANFFNEYDKDVVVKLFEKGYKTRDIVKVIASKCFLAQHVDSSMPSDFMSRYCDGVMQEVARETDWFIRRGKVYEMCYDSYEKSVNALRHKFSHKATQWNEFQEGKAAIQLSREGHFYLPIIKEVLSQHSYYSRDNDKVSGIMDKVSKIQQIYRNIDDTKLNDPYAPVYPLLVKKYMSDNKIRIINGKDEQNIIIGMLKKGISKEKITEIIKSNSPVAIEPGRNLNDYVNTVVQLASDEYERRNRWVKSKASETEQLYKKKIEGYEKYLNEKYHHGILSRTFYDCMAACELFAGNQLYLNVLDTIEKYSPQATKVSESNPNKTPLGYAKFVTASARRSLSRSKDIVNAERRLLPQNETWEKLKIADFSMADLYTQAIKERIEAYPSTAGNLTAAWLDKDIAEKLMTKYKDLDVAELEATIAERSPRAAMAGVPDNYPSKVIETAKERIDRTNKRVAERESLQNEYNRQCGLAAEGVDAVTAMDEYQLGKAALTMIMNGNDVSDVKSAMTENVKKISANSMDRKPKEYIDDIISKVQEVRSRVTSLKMYQPKRNTIPSINDLYMTDLSSMAKVRHGIHSSLDVKAASNLLARGFSANDVAATIKRYSPVAVEPGRASDYVESFVIPRAEQTIKIEREKLDAYMPTARLNHATTAAAEYDYLKDEISAAISLPWCVDMDQLIAITLFDEGFSEEEVADAIDGKSSLAKNDERYSKTLIGKLMGYDDDEKDLMDMVEKSLVSSLVAANQENKISQVETNTKGESKSVGANIQGPSISKTLAKVVPPAS